MNDARKIYGDIIDLPHHVSRRHAQMPKLNRAAQFSPFAALTGYDDLIRETARQTNRQIELDENAIRELNQKLALLTETEPAPTATFTYFVPDSQKAGGSYQERTGRITKYDSIRQTITIDGTMSVPIRNIIQIESDAFLGAQW